MSALLTKQGKKRERELERGYYSQDERQTQIHITLRKAYSRFDLWPLVAARAGESIPLALIFYLVLNLISSLTSFGEHDGTGRRRCVLSNSIFTLVHVHFDLHRLPVMTNFDQLFRTSSIFHNLIESNLFQPNCSKCIRNRSSLLSSSLFF